MCDNVIWVVNLFETGICTNYLNLYLNNDRPTMILDMVSDYKLTRSGATSFFMIENTRSQVLNEAGVVYTLIATLYKFAHVLLWAYQKCNTEWGLEINDCWSNAKWFKPVVLSGLISSVLFIWHIRALISFINENLRLFIGLSACEFSKDWVPTRLSLHCFNHQTRFLST